MFGNRGDIIHFVAIDFSFKRLNNIEVSAISAKEVVFYKMERFSLCFSDLHFGRLDPIHEKKVESDFVALVESQIPFLDALYLVGDVYEIFMEYKKMIPAQVPRFIGLLCKLVDAQIPVYYITGNRDPWHRRFFAQEVGVALISGVFETHLYGHKVQMRHGDTLEEHTKQYKWIIPLIKRGFLLNSLEYGLFGDLGLRLAQFVSRKKLKGNPFVTAGDPQTAKALQKYAQQLFMFTDIEGLVMGHCHMATLENYDKGIYLNCGFWNAHRTYGRISAKGVELCRFPNEILKEMDWKSTDFSVY